MDPTKTAASLANPIPLPQTGALTTPDEEGISSLAAPPAMAQTIAQNQIAAGQVNHGDARDWAENAVAGVTAALAGFGAGGRAPAGAGLLFGAGAAARQQQAQRQEQARMKQEQAARQQEIGLEQQRVTNEQKNADRDYQLHLAENARQQAESVRQQSEHDARMQQMTDEHNMRNFELAHEDLTFRQQQLDREESIRQMGGKPMEIAGIETPGFDDLGALEYYASKNNLAQDAHVNGYRERPILGADGKYHIYEIPDTGPEWHTVKGPDGNPMKIFGDPLSVLNYEEKVAQIRESNARASIAYEEAKKAQDEYKEAGTLKAARKELAKADGDYTKISSGAREALLDDAEKRYSLDWNVYQSARRDMQKDPAYASVPADANGNPDKNSKEYKDLAVEYHVDDAEAILASTYDDLRRLGYGYKAPGSGGGTESGPSAGEQIPKAPRQGEPITPDAASQFLKLANGDPNKAKELAIAAGWGPPLTPAQSRAQEGPGGPVPQGYAPDKGAAALAGQQ